MNEIIQKGLEILPQILPPGYGSRIALAAALGIGGSIYGGIRGAIEKKKYGKEGYYDEKIDQYIKPTDPDYDPNFFEKQKNTEELTATENIDAPETDEELPPEVDKWDKEKPVESDVSRKFFN